MLANKELRCRMAGVWSEPFVIPVGSTADEDVGATAAGRVA